MSFRSPNRMFPWFRANRDAAMGAGQAYTQRVLGDEPIAYWPLWETSGVTAECLVNSAQNGTYVGATLNNADGPDGSPCPWFDGANDYVDIYTATLASAFDPTLGSMFVWARVNAIGVWTDTVNRYSAQIGEDANNRIYIKKDNANNRLEYIYDAGGVVNTVAKTAISDTDWMALALTWDKSADEVKAYYNGVQEGATQNGLGVYAGGLTEARTNIGANTEAPTNLWQGWLAHAAVWDRVLTDAELAGLANV